MGLNSQWRTNPEHSLIVKSNIPFSIKIVYGVTKFYQYIFILHWAQTIGKNSEPKKWKYQRWLQRWALTLCAFDYNIQYVREKENILADPLSRLPQIGDEETNHSLLNIQLLTKRELRK